MPGKNVIGRCNGVERDARSLSEGLTLSGVIAGAYSIVADDGSYTEHDIPSITVKQGYTRIDYPWPGYPSPLGEGQMTISTISCCCAKCRLRYRSQDGLGAFGTTTAVGHVERDIHHVPPDPSDGNTFSSDHDIDEISAAFESDVYNSPCKSIADRGDGARLLPRVVLIFTAPLLFRLDPSGPGADRVFHMEKSVQYEGVNATVVDSPDYGDGSDVFPEVSATVEIDPCDAKLEFGVVAHWKGSSHLGPLNNTTTLDVRLSVRVKLGGADAGAEPKATESLGLGNRPGLGDNGLTLGTIESGHLETGGLSTGQLNSEHLETGHLEMGGLGNSGGLGITRGLGL